jgi:DNA repair protein RadA/Sms
MSKNLTKKKNFLCSNCGAVHLSWSGKCLSCGEWDCIIQNEENGQVGLSKTNSSKIEYHSLSVDESQILQNVPKKTNFAEFDRAVGGGIVYGGVYLIGGDPGVGKSTLLLQICAKMSIDASTHKYDNVYYVSAEESVSQIQLRSARLGISSAPVKLVSTNNINDVISILNTTINSIIVIDSVQTIYSQEIQSFAGSITQIRYCIGEIINVSKARGISVFLVGHITKDGQIAGPKVLEHMVDAVLYFEGEKTGQYRILRSIKNRYGATGEIGIFEMSSNGFIDVENPSKIFLLDKAKGLPGIVTFAGIEGTRIIVCDIEALVSKSFIPQPRRVVVGFEQNRLSMLCAVLDKHSDVKLFDKDIFVNISGGMKFSETAIDLAVCLCILSSNSNKSIPAGLVCFGEVSLSGQIRQVSNTEQRIIELVKMGFTQIICPNFNNSKEVKEKLKDITTITTVSSIKEVLGVM